MTFLVDEARLERWAVEIGRHAARSGVFVALYGPLGSGKSTLARTACRSAGVEGPIPSPTFTLVNRYPLPDGSFVHHVDLYRLESGDEVWELGWQDLVAQEGPVFVEWADRAAAMLPGDRWDIHLDFADGAARRRVMASRRGVAPALPAA